MLSSQQPAGFHKKARTLKHRMGRIDPCASFGKEVSEMRGQTVESQLTVTVYLERAG
jgi:hypothetical protein